METTFLLKKSHREIYVPVYHNGTPNTTSRCSLDGDVFHVIVLFQMKKVVNFVLLRVASFVSNESFILQSMAGKQQKFLASKQRFCKISWQQQLWCFSAWQRCAILRRSTDNVGSEINAERPGQLDHSKPPKKPGMFGNVCQPKMSQFLFPKAMRAVKGSSDERRRRGLSDPQRFPACSTRK